MEDTNLAWQLRDGLLQDLVAVGMLIEGARRAIRDEDSAERVDVLLRHAAEALSGDLDDVRAAIDRLLAESAAA